MSRAQSFQGSAKSAEAELRFKLKLLTNLQKFNESASRQALTTDIE